MAKKYRQDFMDTTLGLIGAWLFSLTVMAFVGTRDGLRRIRTALTPKGECGMASLVHVLAVMATIVLGIGLAIVMATPFLPQQNELDKETPWLRLS